MKRQHRPSTPEHEGFAQSASSLALAAVLDNSFVQSLMAATQGGALSVQNEYASPEGDAARTTVGVGEKSWLQAADEGTWSASAGTGTVLDDGTYEWIAPASAGSATITFTATSGETSTVTMTVLAPSALTATGMTPRSFDAGVPGAGMDLVLTLGPTTVSFANVEWKEVSGGATGVSGYFEGRDGLEHDANPEWSMVGSDNDVSDVAAFQGWPEPWSEGAYTWEIPNKWRVDGQGAGQDLPDSTQRMAITGEDGTSTVSKLGESTSRTP